MALDVAGGQTNPSIDKLIDLGDALQHLGDLPGSRKNYQEALTLARAAGDKTIDINSATREDLLSLPGMTQREADRIIANRPFKNANELVARHIIPESEYGKIKDRIIAGL